VRGRWERRRGEKRNQGPQKNEEIRWEGGEGWEKGRNGILRMGRGRGKRENYTRG
jgi:hypothetical protein